MADPQIQQAPSQERPSAANNAALQLSTAEPAATAVLNRTAAPRLRRLNSSRKVLTECNYQLTAPGESVFSRQADYESKRMTRRRLCPVRE